MTVRVRADRDAFARRQAGGLAVDAVAGVVAVDGATETVLDSVHQRGFHPFAAIGEHGVGRDHLEQRGFLRAEGVGEEGAHRVIDAEAFGVTGDGFHPDFLRDTHGHQVPRLFDPRPHRGRPVELVGCFFGVPEASAVSTSIGASTTMVPG